MGRGACPALVGPTAVGKTDLVLGLATEFPLEIISLDSRQVYRGLRIGTAQPTAEERAACPHHLVDFLSPTERYSARRFRDDFLRVHAEITARGGVPLLAGGTGLYLAVLQEGLLPQPDDATSASIRSRLDALDDAVIRDRLLAADPESWERIPPADRYRSQRALEILEGTGRTMTAWLAERRDDPAGGLAFPTVVLDRERDELRARIAARTEVMLTGGWGDETRDLVERHGPDAVGLQTLGYREIVRHLAGEWDLAAARDEIVLRTAQYAKRQRTWFRPRPREADGRPDDPAVAETLRRLLDTAASA